MNKFALTLITLIIFSITTKAQVPSYIPTNGLVGYWPFNGNANDISGNANNGTVTGAVLTADRFGAANKAYDFNGSSNFITVPDANSLDFTTAFSFSIWLNIPDYTLGTQNLRGAFGKERATDNSGFNFLAVSGFHQQRYGFGLQGGATSVAAYSAAPLTLNTWEHIVGVYNGSVIKLYNNGVLVGSTTAVLTLTNSTFPLFIGKELTSTVRYYKGKIDDFGLWNRALTDTEVTSLYEGCNNFFTTHPSSFTSNISASAQITAVSNSSLATYTWQSNPNNFGWINVPLNSKYSGVSTNTLNVNNVQLSNHLQPFRVIANDGTCADTSTTAILHVTDTCITTTVETLTVTDYTTVTVTNYTTVTVTHHDTVFVTVNDTIFVSVDDTLIINTQLTGIAAPNNINTVKIYPNPANDYIIIDYGNHTTMNNYSLKIKNSLGQNVYTNLITEERIYVDLSTWGGAGLYFVHIIDHIGNTIEIKKIILR